MILIAGGTLIDPSSSQEGEFDLVIEDGIVRHVDRPGAFSGLKVARSISAKGRWIVPGFVDVHVHLREPGAEWKETIATGSEAAALGGYTTICCMPNTSPVNDNGEITRVVLDRARDMPIRVLPIGAVSQGLKGEQMSPLSELRKNGCVAFSDDGEPIWSAGLMRRALEWALMLDVPICCHEEDKSLSCRGAMNESSLSARLGLRGWPKVAEEVMIARDIELARATGGKIHLCHVSSARGVELVRRAKNDGIHVTAEATPHHLVLTEDAVGNYETYAKMSPPLREAEDCAALIAGLADGTIDAVASDHAPHDEDSKRVEFQKAAFGIIGLQTTLPLLMGLVREHKISRRRAVEAMSAGPAKAFGIGGGKLSPGAIADLVIVDPEHKYTLDRGNIASKSINSPFLDRTLQGIADTVFVGGNIVVENRARLNGEAHSE